MAGITAISATKTLDAGGTTPDNAVGSYITKEQISLGLTGSPLSAVWSISKPSSSGLGSKLVSTTALTSAFTPDTEGIYTVSCLVDGVTTYILRIGVLSVANVSAISCLHLLPCSSSQIPVPRSGVMLFYDLDSEKLSIKLPDDSVQEVTTI